MRKAKIPRASRGTVIFGECPEGARIIADMLVDKAASKVVSSWTVETCPPQYRFNKEDNLNGDAVDA